MIILITYIDKKTKQLCVSHGYNVETSDMVILPNNPIIYFDCKFNTEVGEYVLNE